MSYGGSQPSSTNNASDQWPGPKNMAVQRSLMEIFDEFTQVISGELRLMETERREFDEKA